MFLGEYQHTIDTKGRLIIPAKFREYLGEQFVISKGLDGCLFIYPMEAWKELEKKLRSLPITRKDTRAFTRFFFAGASDGELDKQGRVVLPQALREYSNITKDVMIVGMSNRMEVWDLQHWKQYNELNDQSVEQLAEMIGQYDLEI